MFSLDSMLALTIFFIFNLFISYLLSKKIVHNCESQLDCQLLEIETLNQDMIYIKNNIQNIKNTISCLENQYNLIQIKNKIVYTSDDQQNNIILHDIKKNLYNKLKVYKL